MTKLTGRAKKGEVRNPNGRPKGSKNKYTLAKDAVLKAFMNREGELKTVAIEKLMQFVAQTTPKETKVEVDTPIIIRWEE